jgi:hypothetical protein
MINVCLLSAALAGCAANSFSSREQSKPDIGGAPTYAVEVRVRPAAAGESPVVVGDRYRAGLDKANTIIRCMIGERVATRATFLGTSSTAPENCARPLDAVKGRRQKGSRPRG